MSASLKGRWTLLSVVHRGESLRCRQFNHPMLELLHHLRHLAATCSEEVGRKGESQSRRSIGDRLLAAQEQARLAMLIRNRVRADECLFPVLEAR